METFALPYEQLLSVIEEKNWVIYHKEKQLEQWRIILVEIVNHNGWQGLT